MKFFLLLLASLAHFVSSVSGFSVNVFDNFDDGLLNSDYWQVSHPNNPFSDVVESLGYVSVINRGALATNFDLDLPYIVSGKFKMKDDIEIFSVGLRSDLQQGSIFGEISGISVYFNNDSNIIGINEYTNSILTDNYSLTMKDYIFTTNETYSFEIVDTRESIDVYLNNSLELSIENNTHYGTKIGFHSREYYNGNHITEIDEISIETVPEPSSYALLLGVLALGLVALRRR
tara:strand:- start:18 stop:713 length:696 start_codon:yes stop_codon:yes gene_type:complete